MMNLVMCWKATPEWNIKKEIILKIKVEKSKDENIQLFI